MFDCLTNAGWWRLTFDGGSWMLMVVSDWCFLQPIPSSHAESMQVPPRYLEKLPVVAWDIARHGVTRGLISVLNPPTQLVLVAGLLVDNSMYCFYLEYSFNTIHPATGEKKLRVLLPTIWSVNLGYFGSNSTPTHPAGDGHNRNFQASNVDNGDAVTVTPGEVLGDFPVSPGRGWSSVCHFSWLGSSQIPWKMDTKQNWRLVDIGPIILGGIPGEFHWRPLCLR